MSSSKEYFKGIVNCNRFVSLTTCVTYSSIFLLMAWEYYKMLFFHPFELGNECCKIARSKLHMQHLGFCRTWFDDSLMLVFVS